MNLNNDKASIRHIAESKLSSGERLYWVGNPNPLRMVNSNLSKPLFGLVWLTMVYFMFTKLGGNSGYCSSPGNFTVVFQVTLTVFFLAGLSMVFSPIWNYIKAHFRVYALTDKRALIIELKGI